MPLTDDQTETLARQLVAIARWDEQLRGMLQPAPSAGNDGGWRRPTPGPKPPCSVSVLDLLVDVEQRLREYAGNLAEDVLGSRIHGADITPREWAESRRTIPALCDFLRRHLDALASREWAQDAADDIARMHRDFADHAEPPPPAPKPTALNPAAAATTGTAAELSRALTAAGYDVPAGTIRRWGSTGTITKYTDTTGRPVYRLGDIHTHITKETTDG